MPIDGLPNPQIHRMCKRCRLWFHYHEGELCWPPKRGLLSWVHVTLAESVDHDQDRNFYCRPCQEANANVEKKFTKMTTQTLIMVLVVGVLGLVAWLAGVGDLIQRSLRG